MQVTARVYTLGLCASTLSCYHHRMLFIAFCDIRRQGWRAVAAVAARIRIVSSAKPPRLAIHILRPSIRSLLELVGFVAVMIQKCKNNVLRYAILCKGMR